MVQGARGADVQLVQQILNLDYRTRVAPSGVGSKGYETQLYGIATREALKRFQALFIELIGVADGKFNSRTMTVMNAVCKGPYFTGGGGGVYGGIDGTTSTSTTTNQTDTTGPVVTISAPTPGFTDESFRVWIIANEPIKTFNLESFISLGSANLSDLRKESPTTYKVLVTPSKLAAHTISLQIEADAIQDLAGNKNTNASNELSLQLNPRPAGPDVVAPSVSLVSGSLGVITINKSGATDPANLTISFSEPVNGSFTLSNLVVRGNLTLSDLRQLDSSTYSLSVNASAVERATGSVQFPAGLMADAAGNKNTLSTEYQFTVVKLPDVTTAATSPTAQTTYNPGYVDTGSGGSQPQQQGQDPMQALMMMMMASQALKGLTSLFGSNPFGGSTAATQPTTDSAISTAIAQGGKNIGGTVAPSGACVCQPAPTGILTKHSGTGVPGTYIITGIPVGEYVGLWLPPPPLCGKRFAVDGWRYRDPCADAGGQRVGNCCGPTLDSKGDVVKGILVKVN
jgi:hypothetical protein